VTVPITMPSTSPIAQPVRQCRVACAATGQRTVAGRAAVPSEPAMVPVDYAAVQAR
jgi:hypothetical protein